MLILTKSAGKKFRRLYDFFFYVSEFAWICEDWASINVRLFGEKEAFEKMGKEFALMTLSHRGDLDWVAGYAVATRFNFLHVRFINYVNTLVL